MALPRTDSGLISEARSILERVLGGHPPDESEAREFAERVRHERLAEYEDLDPIFSTTRRILAGGPRYLAGLIALTDILIPDEASTTAPAEKVGA